MAPEWPFISRRQGMQVGSSGRGDDYIDREGARRSLLLLLEDSEEAGHTVLLEVATVVTAHVLVHDSVTPPHHDLNPDEPPRRGVGRARTRPRKKE
jgi:hypothetical protein